MELFDSEENMSPELREELLKEPAETSAPASRSEAGQSLLNIILMALVAIILVFLLVIFARWLYHKTHHAVEPQPAGTKQLSVQSSGTTKQPVSNPVNNPAASSNPSPSTTQNNSLPNGGAGDVIAIFAASAAAAGGLHYIIRLRQFNKTGL